MWLTPEQVAQEVRAYIGKGIDFIKYGSNEHYAASGGAFLAFSPRTQAVMVEEAHRAGITAQAHTMSVEGLRIAIEAGCDLIQHANITGPVPIPETTLDLMATRGTGAVVFPFTKHAFDWLMENGSDMTRTSNMASDNNARNLIRSGAPLLLANDGAILAPEVQSDPMFTRLWGGSLGDSLYSLATGHFYWLKAMEEKGCPPMEMLKAATRNIAVAYRKDKDLGTLEEGKIADVLILNKDPLQAAENYRSIEMILKDGVPVNRDILPEAPILTRPMDPPAEEESSYVPFLLGRGTFPACPVCVLR
jgi:imidazolonepropionase-like amidohydrolase